MLSSAFIKLEEHDLAASAELTSESLRLFEEANMPMGASTALFHLARTRMAQGKSAEDKVLLDKAIQLGRQHDDYYLTGLALHDLGELARTEGDERRVASLFAEALHCFSELGDLGKVAWCLEGIAGARGWDDPDQAARFLGVADALRTSIAWPLPAGEVAQLARETDGIRDRMGDEAFAAAWSVGGSQPFEEILSEARTLTSPLG
jgi:hypothetical protein